MAISVLLNFELMNDFIEPIDYFKNKEVLSMDKIEWWLLKYSELYGSTSKEFYNRFKKTLADGTEVRLPPICITFDEEYFLDLYRSLESISNRHRKEDYFEKEIASYRKRKDSIAEIRKWLEKNENIGSKEFVDFTSMYLDYSDHPHHLFIYIRMLPKLEIMVNRNDFKNTIHFLDIFNKLFWDDKLLPEAILRIDEEIRNDPNTII